ncbi:MAG: glycosyltransferase family 2 protein [Hyphomicrobiales bacterium]
MKNKVAPSVSVVIPAHNRKEWIAKALHSAKQQTYSAIVEIIVVDDASVDGTADFIKTEFPDVVVFVNEQNKGACFSRNKGAQAATGDYIAFLDSDDQFHEQKIELQMAAMLRENCPLSTCAFEDSAGHIICKKDLSNSNVNRILRYRNCLGGSSAILILRRLFLEHSFNEEMKAAQDWEFLYRVTKDNPTAHLTQPLYYHETESNNRITDSKGSRFFGHSQLYEKHLKDHLASKITFFFLLGFLKNDNKIKHGFFQKFYMLTARVFAVFE